MDWLDRLRHRRAAPARTGRLDTAQARQVAVLHHQGGFARLWDPGECAVLLADPSVLADGVFSGSAVDPSGFVMSRIAADEAEILSVVVAKGSRRGGLAQALLVGHLARLAARGVARLWDPGECAALLADPSVLADGVFSGSAVEPSGFVMSRIAADEAEILSIVVAKGSRRGGLAQALLAGHLARLAARGVARLFLEVEETNAAAVGLYRQFGFAEVGRREGYYPKPDGSRAAALVMRLDLG